MHFKHTYTLACTHAHTLVHTPHTHTHMHSRTHTHAHTCTHTHTHTHAHTPTHTYAHAHIHTHTYQLKGEKEMKDQVINFTQTSPSFQTTGYMFSPALLFHVLNMVLFCSVGNLSLFSSWSDYVTVRSSNKGTCGAGETIPLKLYYQIRLSGCTAVCNDQPHPRSSATAVSWLNLHISRAGLLAT